MTPFFLRQYVKGHAADVFEAYPQLLTEMALRLPYQVQKHSSLTITFPQVIHLDLLLLLPIYFCQQTGFLVGIALVLQGLQLQQSIF